MAHVGIEVIRDPFSEPIKAIIDRERIPLSLNSRKRHREQGRFRGFYQSLKESPSQFLEFLEILKRPGTDVSNLAVIQRAATGTCANRNETPCRCWRPF